MPRLIADEHLNFYKSRGVPGSALFGNAPENIKDHLTTFKVETDRGPTRVLPEKQSEYFIQMRDSDRPFLTVIAGQSDDALAAQAALLACADMISKDATKRFYWHTVTGAFRDKVRDDDVVADDVKGCGLLILSNIAKNSTNAKFEKVRDILELYSTIPRIVLVSGCDPMDFCVNILYTKPRYAIYFGR